LVGTVSLIRNFYVRLLLDTVKILMKVVKKACQELTGALLAIT
jgi:hypothetical protein